MANMLNHVKQQEKCIAAKYRPTSIVLKNLPIMLSGISQNLPYYAQVSAYYAQNYANIF